MAKKTPVRQNRPTAPAAPTATPSNLIQVRTVTQAFEGPVPHPSILEHYNKIIPDAAERILRMAERENEHRHQQEDEALKANISVQERQITLAEIQSKAVFRSDALGQILGAAVGLTSVFGAIYLATISQGWVAAALVGLPLAGIIRALRERPTASQQQSK